jgi:hypothetical protein
MAKASRVTPSQSHRTLSCSTILAHPT